MSFVSWFRKCLYHRQTILASRFRPTIQVLGHVCFTVILALLPFCLFLCVSIWSGVSSLEVALEDERVAFSIQDGELNTSLTPLPDQIKTDSLKVFVDPHEQILEDESSESALFLQQDKAILLFSQYEQELSYNLLGEGEHSKDAILDQIQSLKGFLPVLLVITALMILVVGIASAFIGSSLLALLALPFYQSRKNIQFIHLWKISVHTLPLPLIIYAWAVVWLDTLSIAWFFIPYVCLYVYVLLTLSHKKKSRKTS